MRITRVDFLDLHPEDGGRVLMGLELDEPISESLERTISAATPPPQVHRLEGDHGSTLLYLGLDDTHGIKPALGWLLSDAGLASMVSQAAALDSNEHTLIETVQRLIDEHP